MYAKNRFLQTYFKKCFILSAMRRITSIEMPLPMSNKVSGKKVAKLLLLEFLQSFLAKFVYNILINQYSHLLSF